MKRLLLLALILCSLGAVRPPKPGEVVFVFQIGDGQLWEQIQEAERWKDFFMLSGDIAWAAYYAGREAVLREQYAELWNQVGLGPVLP